MRKSKSAKSEEGIASFFRPLFPACCLSLVFGSVVGDTYNRATTGYVYACLLTCLLVLATTVPYQQCGKYRCFSKLPGLTCCHMYLIVCSLLGVSLFLVSATDFRFRQYTFYNVASFADYAMNVPTRTFHFGGFLQKQGSFTSRVLQSQKQLQSRGQQRMFMPPNMDIEFRTQSFHLNGTYKQNAVPIFLRDIAMPRKSWGSGFLGRSVFLTNVQDRGPRNQLKRLYMSALTGEKIAAYVASQEMAMHNTARALTKCANKPNTTCVHETVKSFVRDAVFWIHAEREMEEEDRLFWDSGFAALNAINTIKGAGDIFWMTAPLWNHIQKHEPYVKRLASKIQDGTFGGLFRDLSAAGLTATDVAVEYLHNIFAGGMQWTDLFEVVLLDLPFTGTSPTYSWVYETIRMRPIAPFVISSTTSNGLLSSKSSQPSHIIHSMNDILPAFGPHDPERLKENSQTITCPVSGKSITSPDGAVVVSGTQILEGEGNWGFGRGARRCAGEVLTLEMTLAWLKALSVSTPTLRYSRGGEGGFMGLGSLYYSTVVAI